MSPAPGVANNPSGANGTQSFDGFNTETPYGQIKRVQQSTQVAPVATPAGNAPKRATRRAMRPRTAAPAPSVQPEPAPPAPLPSYDARLATQLDAIAQIPGASPLVQEYAQAARGRLNAAAQAVPVPQRPA